MRGEACRRGYDRDVAGDLILAIESSCDETSAAVVRAGREVLSNVVASQMVHGNYGGVVPELASREHLRAIVPVTREALARAGVSYADLSAVAVTEGPGLAGALLVGITFAKAISLGTGLPLIGVNHLEGHIHAVLMAAAESLREASPLLALVVSGGHTHLYLCKRESAGEWRYRNVGRTLDDAAGEAYDKVAKVLGLPYPGGPWMDVLAAHGDPQAVKFTFAQLKNKPRLAPKLRAERGGVDGERRFDFSFSGIKTAVRRHVETHGMREAVAAREAALRGTGLWNAKAGDPAALAAVLGHFDEATLGLIASFQSAVAAYLLKRLFDAAQHFGARGIVVSGGVSANSLLRSRGAALAARYGLPIAFPRVAMSTDNAAMIGAAAWPKFRAGRFADGSLEPTPQLRLG